MELSIIIVNYNVRCFLEQCLHTVAKAIATIKSEVIIVDNASSDGSLDYLKPLFPSYRFLENLENTGFAKANNQAFKVSKGRFILFLNPDTLLPEDCLLKCLDFIKSQSNPGAVGIRMLDGSGQFLPESKRAFPSPISAFYKLIGLSALFPKSAVFNHYSLGQLSEHENQIVDVLAGAFMLVPQTVLLETGGFDEQFFMYGEDIDLSYRIQKAGFINHYFADSCIIHFKGESTRKGSLNYVLLFYNAMRIFVQKNYRGGKAGIFAFFIQLAIFFRAIFSLANQLVFKPLGKIVHSHKPVGSNHAIAIIVADGYFPDMNAYFNLPSNQTDKSSPTNKLAFFSISNCKMLLNDHNYQTILFCEGNGLTWKKIIETVAVFSTSEKTLVFHSKNSYSIVGSDSRETSGKAVSIVK